MQVFDPALGISQLSVQQKMSLVVEINEQYVLDGHSSIYTVDKLESWLGNALYRYRCNLRGRRPASWQPGKRSKAGSAQNSGGSEEDEDEAGSSPRQ